MSTEWSNIKSYTWDLDTAPPSISATPASRTYDNTTADVTVTASDAGVGLSTLEYAWSTTTTTPSSWTTINSGNVVSQSESGEWYLHVRATDTSGNINTTYFGTYNIDKVDPVISVSPTSRENIGSDISATINVTENESGIGTVEYAWSEDTAVPTAWTSTTNGSTVTQTAVGDWYLHVRATDTAGNSNTTYFGIYKRFNYEVTVESVSQSGNTLVLDWVYKEYVLLFPDINGYLYNEGSYEALWNIGYNSATDINYWESTFTKAPTYLMIEAVSSNSMPSLAVDASWVGGRLVDVTDYNNIVANYNHWYGDCFVLLSTDPNLSDYNNADFQHELPFSSINGGEETIDISSLSGEYYVYFWYTVRAGLDTFDVKLYKLQIT